MSLLYNEIRPITGMIQWVGSILYLDYLAVLEGIADVVDVVDDGAGHHTVSIFKGELCQYIGHLLKGIREGCRVGAGRLLILNHGGDFFQSGLGQIEALYQVVVTFLVFGLIQRRPFQVGPVYKLKRNGFLYGIFIISTARGYFL